MLINVIITTLNNTRIKMQTRHQNHKIEEKGGKKQKF